MLTDFLDRMQAALRPGVEAAGGMFAVATDRNDAIAQAVMHMGAKWMALIWITGGETGTDDTKARRGYCESDYCVAVVRRPVLDSERAAKTADACDADSLLNLWEQLRQLVCRVRFGEIAQHPEADDHLVFMPRDGYLNGDEPMQLRRFIVERQVFEIEGGGPAARRKELLWGESTWRVKLALPTAPAPGTPLRDWWLLT